MSMKSSWILIMALAAGCAEQTPVDLAPCPCLEGYTCCPSLGQCLPTGSAVTLCPSTTRPPPLSCTLEENDDGSSLIRCSDGSTFPGKEAPPECGEPDVYSDVEINDIASATRLRGVRRIQGLLRVGSNRQSIVQTIELPCLESVDRIDVSNTDRAPVSLSLPALTAAREVSLAYNVIAFEAARLAEVDRLEIRNTDLSSLQGLRGLRHVRDKLIIASNEQLTSLDGLVATATVGDLELNGPELVSAEGLSGLRWVTGGIDIGGTGLSSLAWLGRARLDGPTRLSRNALRTLEGLEGRPVLRGDLVIDEPALDSLDALSGLTTVEGNLEIKGGTFTSVAPLHALTRAFTWVLSGTQVTSLEGLPEALVTGGVGIDGNHDLRSLEGLVVLPSGDWLDISITGNAALADVALRGPADSNMRIYVSENPSLVDLRGLEWMTRASAVTVAANAQLAHLTGLDRLTRVGTLTLSDNPVLLDLHGLEGVSASIDTVRFYGNASLADLGALSGATLSGSVELRGNRLTSLRGLANSAPELGQLSIRDEPALLDLSGLGPLTSVRSLEITRNGALVSLAGLQVDRVVGYFTISGNPSLRTLASSNPISSVQRLEVSSNPRLTDLAWISSATVTDALSVSTNACLPQCLVSTLRDRVEATTGISTTFSGNRRDCTCTTAPDGTVTAQCPPRIECD
jgi:hypothetical protein